MKTIGFGMCERGYSPRECFKCVRERRSLRKEERLERNELLDGVIAKLKDFKRYSLYIVTKPQQPMLKYRQPPSLPHFKHSRSHLGHKASATD
eukprot:1320633-Amorphochlora_amoeboformis.AAC.1